MAAAAGRRPQEAGRRGQAAGGRRQGAGRRPQEQKQKKSRNYMAGSYSLFASYGSISIQIHTERELHNTT